MPQAHRRTDFIQLYLLWQGPGPTPIVWLPRATGLYVMPPASDPPYSAPERVTDFRAAITAVRDQGTNMDDDQEAAFSLSLIHI